MSKQLLNNPDRGFRLEAYIDAANGGWYPGSEDGQSAIQHTDDEIAYYASDSPKLVQLYVYLTKYYNKDLDQTAFNNMQTYFNYLKSKGYKVLLRFAYEWDDSLPTQTMGPTTAQVLRHINQLKPFLEKNQSEIYMMYAGFIGLWGEWHHPAHIPQSDYKTILEAVIDATPPSLYVLARLVDYKNLLDPNDPRRNRVGYDDDYLVGVENAWNTGGFPDTPEWVQETKEAPFVPSDGEMPWGTDTAFVTYVDAYKMASRLALHCFDSLSIVHHYKEGGGAYSMVQWQSEVTSPLSLDNLSLPYAKEWFTDQNGKSMQRSMFAYIRDYLGYYIAASNVKAKISGNSIQVSLTLTNYGFAAPLTMNKPQLLVLDKNQHIISTADICNVVDLQSKKAVTKTLSLTLPSNPYNASIGIRFTNSQGTPAELANNIPFSNGVNILGKLIN